MIRSFLLVFFVTMCFSGITQTSDSTLQPIENWISKYQDSGSIVYTDKLYEQLNTRLVNVLKKRKLKDYDSKTEGDMIELTNKERKYLVREAKSVGKYVWKDSLFRDFKRIPADSVLAYLSDYNNRFVRTFKDDSLKTEFRGIISSEYIRPNVFMFSKPIFFRNKTFCMFYIFWRCGHSCGKEEVVFYKQVNNSWVKWIVPYEGWI